MIIYNQTIKVENSINEAWLGWMKSEYLPGVLATGLFSNYHFNRLLGQDETEGITYTVQFFCDSVAQHSEFMEKESFALQQSGFQRFGQKYLYFETLMESVI